MGDSFIKGPVTRRFSGAGGLSLGHSLRSLCDQILVEKPEHRKALVLELEEKYAP